MGIDIEVPIIAVFGYKKSGKTEIIRRLILGLSRRGLKVGVIKHISHEDFSTDVKGKDTWKFMNAGAKITVGASRLKIALVERLNGVMNLNRIIEYLKGSDLDVIFLEGFKSVYSRNKDVYKILMAKNVEELRELYDLTSPPIIAISGRVAENMESFQGVPVLDLMREEPKIIHMIEEIIGC